MYIPDNDTQTYFFCRLQLVVKMIGHSTWWTNQLKLNKSCYDNERKNAIIPYDRYYKIMTWHDVETQLNESNFKKMGLQRTYSTDR